MESEHCPSIVPIRSPWRETLLEALKQTRQALFMICPYIKDEIIAAMQDALTARPNPSPLEVRVITRALPDEFLSGSSDISALQHLLAWPAELTGSRVEIRVINNVHAKVWIFDNQLAMVGSGNATPSGLEENLEYGLAVTDPQLVQDILQDWQFWWEQATTVDPQGLEEMRLWLAKMADDEELRALEAAANEKRKAIERKLGTTPRIGRRLALRTQVRGLQPPKAAEPPTPYAVEPGVSGISHSPDETSASGEQSVLSAAAIRVSTRQLWQALSWVFPESEQERAYRALQGNAHHDTYLKLAWIPTPPEHQTLQCIWADGTRLSRASIVGHNLLVQEPWTITLNSQSIRILANFLQMDQQGEPRETELLLALETPYPHRLHISHAPGDAGRGTIISRTLPCMLASARGDFPALRPPISRITVQHAFLLETLKTLKQRWQAAQPEDHPLVTIELSFASPGETPAILLTTGPIDVPLQQSVPATACVLAGPGIRLRLDFMALQQVLASTSDTNLHWNICVGRNAEAVQFIPEPAPLDDASLVWRHELRDIVG